MANGIITINTDAGFYQIEKVGSFAFWIKGDNIFLQGSGVFKEICSDSTDAETKAMSNALHVLSKMDLSLYNKIIFNRDNIHAKPNLNSKHESQKKLHHQIGYLKKKYHQNKLVIEFRHVRAHTKKDDKRSFVNEWCDAQCKQRLREWKKSSKFVQK